MDMFDHVIEYELELVHANFMLCLLVYMTNNIIPLALLGSEPIGTPFIALRKLISAR